MENNTQIAKKNGAYFHALIFFISRIPGLGSGYQGRIGLEITTGTDEDKLFTERVLRQRKKSLYAFSAAKWVIDWFLRLG